MRESHSRSISIPLLTRLSSFQGSNSHLTCPHVVLNTTSLLKKQRISVHVLILRIWCLLSVKGFGCFNRIQEE